MSRQRWFCAYCGQMTRNRPGWDNRVRCDRHAELELDPVDNPAIGSRHMKAATHREAMQANKEKGA